MAVRMFRIIKRIINRCLRAAHLRLVSDWEWNVEQPSMFGDCRARWLRERQVTLLLDVGANTGQFGTRVIRGGYDGKIVSIEPLSSAYSELRRNINEINTKQWTSLNLAVGERSQECDIHIAGNSASSSLCRMSNRHEEALPDSTYVGKERIKVVRLDELWPTVVAAEDVVWLKIDVQGAESAVLDGLGEIPEQVVAVELELSLIELYDGQTLMPEMTQRLMDAGFTPVAFDDAFRDLRNGETLQLDGIFLRSAPQRNSSQLEVERTTAVGVELPR